MARTGSIGRGDLESSAEEVENCGAGGLSGPPVRERSLEVLRRLRAKVGDQLALISVGGIETAEQARERIKAGATLVQIYTAFIYEGPWLPSRLARGVVEKGV